MTDIAVIVPVHNRRETTLVFLRQLRAAGVDGIDLKVIIVDDGSTDGTSEAVRRQDPEVTILRGDGNLWWTGAVRKGAEYALGRGHETLLIMNDDLELDKRFLAELLKVARANPDALISSIKLNRTKDGQEKIITAGSIASGVLREVKVLHADEPLREDLPEVLECDMLTGSSLLIRANVFQKIGMFDDKDCPQQHGDLDFTLRASRSGFRCLVATRSRIYTEYNPNSGDRYLVNSSRKDYFRNLFDRKKFSYGFKSIRDLSYMHKPFLLGTILYARRSLGLMKKIIMKACLPNKALRMMVRGKSLSKK